MTSCSTCARGGCVLHESLFAELRDPYERDDDDAMPSTDSRSALHLKLAELRELAQRVRDEHPCSAEATLADYLDQVELDDEGLVFAPVAFELPARAPARVVRLDHYRARRRRARALS